MVFVAVGLLAGCTPEPLDADPTPTFTSEAEAFAAAEATYRAYVDALNDVDLSDPETFEAVYSWTTGEALAGAKKSFTTMAADGWSVSGDSRFDNFDPIAFDEESSRHVTAHLCLDVTLVEVVDSAGVSQVPDTRADRQPAIVTFAPAKTPTSLAIAMSTATNEDTCEP